jgi:predicted SAM-dependent methyltransferase
MRSLKKFIPQPIKVAIKFVISHCRQLQTRSLVRKLLKSGKPIWLDIGAGFRKSENGWITLDLCKGSYLYWDLARGLPFPENTIEKLYSSHVFEHFTPEELRVLLAECKRVLVPGGTFSVAVPNARIWIDAYVKRETLDPVKFCGMGRNDNLFAGNGLLDQVNYIAYMGGGHKYLFDVENLLTILRKSGFKEVAERDFDSSIDMAARRHQSIYAQCVK